MIRFIDLFAGIGGFRYGLERCNKLNTGSRNQDGESQPDTTRSDGKGRGACSYACVWSNEWDKYASQIYDKNFGSGYYSWDGEHENYVGGIDTRDITKVPSTDIPDHDLLVGGFPCQAFSIAGKRQGFNDTRGTLFFEIARILRDKRPRHFLLENVKGLLSHDEGKTFQTILGVLSDLGYEYSWQVLNSKNFGVPQNRERVFIVGHLRGQPRPKVFPVGSNGKQNGELKQNTKQDQIASTISSMYAKNQHQSQYISNKVSIRRLTPTECERLQGFPDGWTEGISDTQRYKCLGNAVTTNVVRWIGEQLIRS